MSAIETLFTWARLADGSTKDIGVANGRVVPIEESGTGGNSHRRERRLHHDERNGAFTLP